MAKALTNSSNTDQRLLVTDVENMEKALPRVEVSWGEFLDKISILKIKAERMTSPASVTNVQRELAHLNGVVSGLPPLPLLSRRDALVFNQLMRAMGRGRRRESM